MPPADMTPSATRALLAADLRPTAARVAILEVLQDAAGEAMSVDTVFQRLADQGRPRSMGTVYRVVQELVQGGLLLREWQAGRKSLHRARPSGSNAQHAPSLVFRRRGHDAELVDPALNACLLIAARRLGLSLAGRRVLIEVD